MTHRSEDLYQFQYSFFPVGQGLFTSGLVTKVGCRPFQWVYDCGTVSQKSRCLLLRQINTLRGITDSFKGNKHLDLACISHFDKDHISGFADLLRYYTIGTLLIPYLYPWERLEIAFNTGISIDDWFMKFLVAPAQYFIDNFPGRINRILLVGSGGEAQPPESRISPLEPTEKKDIIFSKKGDSSDEIKDYTSKENHTSEVDVSLLQSGGTITVPYIWEFVPYNDAVYNSCATDSFKKEANKCLEIIKNNQESDIRKKINELKKIYDAQFKSSRAKKISPKRRNVISLFLYCGPIGKPILIHLQEYRLRRRHLQWRIGFTRHACFKCSMVAFWLAYNPFFVNRKRCLHVLRDCLCYYNGRCHDLNESYMGQLLTGDGYLKTDNQINALKKFYTPYSRLNKSAVLQVMHHGSRYNWCSGVAKILNPKMSIFSSDPKKKGLHHPHIEVWRDFIDHHPIQVDDRNGWALRGLFTFL